MAGMSTHVPAVGGTLDSTKDQVGGVTGASYGGRKLDTAEDAAAFLAAYVDLCQGLAKQLVNDDWEVCRCQLHQQTPNGVVGGEGCSAKQHGKLAVLAGLYGSQGHKHCGAHPGVRATDARVAKLALDLGNGYAAYAGGALANVGGNCAETLPTDWGAGYCYMVRFPARFRFTVGRLLGPCPLVIDVLALQRVAGLAAGRVAKVVQVQAPGGAVAFHVVPDKVVKGVRDWAGKAFVYDLMEAVRREGPGVRVGWAGDVGDMQLQYVPATLAGHLPEGATARFEVFREWARKRGEVFDESTLVDFVLASTALVRIPPDQYAAKSRVRRFELVGDRYLKLLNAVRGLASGTTVEAIAKADEGCSNIQLAMASNNAPLKAWMDYAALPSASKVRGSMVETFLGFVLMHVGPRLVAKLVDESAVLVLDVAPAEELEVEFPPEVDVTTAVAMLEDFGRRGGDRAVLKSELVKLVEQLG